METVRFVLNADATTVQWVRRNGREWIVAPMTTIVPGVLNGSKGALLYLPRDIRQNIAAWNRVPITVHHPIAANGQHVSASAPGIWQRQGIGHLERSRWEGKLKHDGWFDVGRLRQVEGGTHILNALEHGERMELSTGLFTDNVPEEGVWNGVGYRFVAKRHVPDHLAILPDQVGACSIQDGCGLNVNHAGPKEEGCGDGG